MIISKPSLKVVATVLAKNEADIIKEQIEHHLNQGVFKIIFTDNNSSDNTKEIASKYKEVEIIEESENDHNQSKWVTRMAEEAIKFNPDWIIHLDADEFWCNIMSLKNFDCEVVGCQRMYMHPPQKWEFDFKSMQHYLDMDHIPFPQECKIAHRPIEGIVIEHGNHGVVGNYKREHTTQVSRHHYPIRSYDQLLEKIKGHEALQRRGVVCERWAKWHKWNQNQELQKEYAKFTDNWKKMIANPSAEYFLPMLDFWSEDHVTEEFKSKGWLPRIGIFD